MSHVVLSPKLEGVTVYDHNAQLSFSATVPLTPGSTMVAVVEKIEQWGSVDWNTVQLRMDPGTDAAITEAVFLQSLNPVHEWVTEDVREQVQAIKDEMTRLEEAVAVCEEEITVLDESCAHVKAISDYVQAAAFAIPGGSAAAATEPLNSYFGGYLNDPAQWTEMAQFVSTSTGGAQRAIAVQRRKKTELERELNLTRERFYQLGGDSGERRSTRDTLEASFVVGDSVPAGTVLRVEVLCVVAGAGWSPLYDLRVDYAESMLDVFYYANVHQSTALNWDKVRLQLSTATPAAGGAPPSLWPRWTISIKPPAPRPVRRVMGRAMGSCKRMSARPARTEDMLMDEMDSVAPMVGAAAVVGGGGASSSAAFYAIPGLVTVRCDNAPVRVTVVHSRFPARLRFLAIPKVDPLTYLSAVAVNATAYEFIAGPSKVFYGSTFVNQAQLGNVCPGEEFEVALGSDETVRVSRSLVRRAESHEASLLTGTAERLSFHYAFAVECGAVTGNKPVSVVVKDNYPVSDDAEVKVELKEPAPVAGEASSITVDEDTHEIVWTFPMRKNEKKSFDLVFNAKYPTKTSTFGLD